MQPNVDVVMEKAPFPNGRAADPLIEDARAHLFFTFKPIVSVMTGHCYGYQAAAQTSAWPEFAELDKLYDEAQRTGVVQSLELMLQEKALRDFCRFSRKGERLFLSINRRTLFLLEHALQRTLDILIRFDLLPTTLCLELSEPLLQPGSGVTGPMLNRYRHLGCPLVLDQFGCGGAALLALHNPQIKMLRLDTTLSAGMFTDERKRLTVATIVNHARVLGISVIADGVSSEGEFLFCKQIGCDLVQGTFISPAVTVSGAFRQSYEMVAEANRRERRERHSDIRLLREELTQMPAVNVKDPMSKVFHVFRSEKEHAFLPILDDRRQPLGIIREVDLRGWIYSRYGKDLLHNKALHRGLLDFMRACPVCDINTETEKILEVFSHAANPPGIILVDDFEYVGVLTAASLLRVINEKNLALARDQNPLTRLPGNRCINEHIAAAFDDESACWTFVYFDLDNFKPFNDKLGFRQGDRAILMFSELMRSSLSSTETFLGHIGGDDFFASFRDGSAEQVQSGISTLLESFKRDAECLYDYESRQRGSIVGRGRDGITQQFPLLSCSAALVILTAGKRAVAMDDLGGIIAELKKAAKQSPGHMVVRILV